MFELRFIVASFKDDIAKVLYSSSEYIYIKRL